MGGALLKGWLANGLGPVVAVEPEPSAQLKKLTGVRFVPDVERLSARPFRACVVALKPQVLKIHAMQLRGIANGGAPMISIAAGTGIASLKKAWGPKARIIRAMPNTPGAIGRGITALYASPAASAKDKALSETLLGALGETIWVKSEALIDAATALSGSGPAYVFLLVEAIAAAGEAQGLPRAVAEKLARATIVGAAALLEADRRAASELRRDVTSPGGTTEAALKILLAKDGMAALMRRAIAAARKRATELG
jgi:pyrroline-5-carboxylate reductase